MHRVTITIVILNAEATLRCRSSRSVGVGSYGAREREREREDGKGHTSLWVAWQRKAHLCFLGIHYEISLSHHMHLRRCAGLVIDFNNATFYVGNQDIFHFKRNGI